MNPSVYQIQKIANQKFETIYLQLNEDSFKLSKEKDLSSYYETKLSWEDEIHLKFNNLYNDGSDKHIKIISLLKKNKKLTFFHDDSSVLNQIFLNLKSRILLTSFEEHFQTIKVLGRGNFGTVHLSQSLLDKKRYATKSIEMKDFDRKDSSLLALKNEIKILRKMNHPNIIKLHSVFKDDEKFHLVLDFIKGIDLKQYLIKNGPLSMQESIIILERLIEVAKYLKELRIIHRDIKPENIMIRDAKISKENIILIDFGLAETVSSHSYDNLRCGTPGFIAPEILRFQKNRSNLYDEESDIFGIGMTWYFSLFGRIPYSSKDPNEILIDNKECKFKFDFSNKYEEIKDILASFLEQDPKKRIDLKKMNSDFFFDLYCISDRLELEENDLKTANVNITLFNMNKIIPSLQALKKFVDEDTNDSIIQSDEKMLGCEILAARSLF